VDFLLHQLTGGPVTVGSGAPPTPSSPWVTGTTASSVSLAWNDVSGETGYRLYKWDGVSSFLFYRQLGANQTAFTDTGLNCGSWYWYELSAINGSGESGRSDMVASTTQACPATDVPLSNGVPYPDSMAAASQQGTWKYYYIDVPSGTPQLTVTLDQLTADLDLYVRAGAKPNGSTYDCLNWMAGTTSETCTFASPVAGRWWIGILNWDTGTINYRVTATYTTGSGDVQLSNGVPHPDSLTAASTQSTWRYYYIDLPSGVTQLSVRLDLLTADADLYVKPGAKPDLINHVCRSWRAGTATDLCSVGNPTAGRWWVGIVNYSTGTIDYRVTASFSTGSGRFFTVAPCRVVDTRNPSGAYGGPALDGGFERGFTIAGQCGIPSTATAVSVNVAATQGSAGGNLRLFPAGSSLPSVATINYSAGQTRSNNAIVTLNAFGQIDAYCSQASGTAHFILDVNGYFQ
jgi:hypothetical protein